MPEKNIERRGVGMYPEDWAIIEQINQFYGFRNISQSLRFIVSEYQRLKTTYERPNLPEGKS